MKKFTVESKRQLSNVNVGGIRMLGDTEQVFFRLCCELLRPEIVSYTIARSFP